jgi:hypothetical protein
MCVLLQAVSDTTDDKLLCARSPVLLCTVDWTNVDPNLGA